MNIEENQINNSNLSKSLENKGISQIASTASKVENMNKPSYFENEKFEKFNSKTENKIKFSDENNRNDINTSKSLNKINSKINTSVIETEVNDKKEIEQTSNLNDEKVIDAEENLNKSQTMLTNEIKTRESLVELPEENDKANYINYENLNSCTISDISEFKETLLKGLKNVNDWKEQFESINTVRSLNKYHYSIFYMMLEDVIELLPGFTSSVRP